MRRLWAIGIATSLLAGAAAPAWACHAVEVCLGYELVKTATGTWALTGWYTAGSEVLTGVALYASSDPGTTLTGATSSEGGWHSAWVAPPGTKSTLVSAKNDTGNQLYSADDWSSWFRITFTGPETLNQLAGLGVRATFASGNWDDDALSDYGPDCPPPNTVPEPVTMLLLGSGLLGIGGVQVRRRRK